LAVVGVFSTMNLLIFLVLFEVVTYTIALLVFMWGSSSRKWVAFRRLCYYSFFSVVPLIIAMVKIFDAQVGAVGSFDYLRVSAVVAGLNTEWRYFI
jgi:NADH:ubiquinone oxidoreductase subunit 4 (subunit M)